MSNKYKNKPSHIGYDTAIKFNCEYCGIECYESKNSYNKKKKHFCSVGCYADYRKNIVPFYEQNAYKGVRKEQDTKQIYHRRYCKTHKENIAHLKARRYAKEKNAEGSHTLKEWSNLKDKYDNRCAICGLGKKLTKDHIIPLSKGGTDYIENIQPLCRNCNSKKHNKILHENPELIKG